MCMYKCMHVSMYMNAKIFVCVHVCTNVCMCFYNSSSFVHHNPVTFYSDVLVIASNKLCCIQIYCNGNLMYCQNDAPEIDTAKTETINFR